MGIDVAGFEIEAEIGRGGFGIVYRARQMAFDRTAAVKVLLPGTSDAEIGRLFARECRAVGALPAHPNIVTVYSSGSTTDGRPYIAMQYLGGGSLADRGPLPADTVTRLGIRLADGLGVAHAGGVIHRDVKPANILFSEVTSVEPVLVDFGISALVGDGSTTSTDLALSVAYASPEVLRGERVTVAADVYALGATLYTAATGRTPFANPDGLTPVATLATRILTQPIEDHRFAGIPRALHGVIERCLAKDVRQRYASMAEVRAALESAAAGVVPAGPRPMRRRSLFATVAAVAVLGGGIATAAVATSDDPTPSPVADRIAGLSDETTTPTTLPSSSASPSAVAPSADLQTGDVAGVPGRRAPRDPVAAPAPATVPAPATTAKKAPRGSKPHTRTVTVATTPVAPPPPAQHAPVLAALPAFRAPEAYTARAQLKASDADGGQLTYRVKGLPRGLTATADGLITGTVSPLAATVTSSYKALKSKTFTITVTVTDSTGRTAVGRKAWVVIDTLFAYPNYVGYRGCNGTGSCKEPVRNYRLLGPAVVRCKTVKNKALWGRVAVQGTKAGTYTRYGYKYLYYVGQKSC